MLTNKIARTLLIVLILFSNIGCDQISKSIVRSSIVHNEQIHFFDRHVMLTRVENAGAFLSLGTSLSDDLRFFLLTVIPMFVLATATIYLFIKNDLSRSMLIGTGFVVGGGIGNIYDRFIYGSVTDFLHLDFFLFRTGIFNMADVSIMTGVFIVLISFMLKHTKPPLDLPADSN